MAGKVVIDRERCKGCLLCVSVCPQGILSLGDAPNARGYYPVQADERKMCTACSFCALICPDVALEIYKV